MSKKLPKQLYGCWENLGTQDEYLKTADAPEQMVDTGETVKAGLYKLVGYVTIVNTTETRIEAKNVPSGP